MSQVKAIRRMRIAIASAVIVVLLGGCEGSDADGDTVTATPNPAEGALPWPRPAEPLELVEAAGLELDTREHVDYHVHAHLEVFVNGQPVEVPAAIGIVIEDPAVKEFQSEFGTEYGGLDPEVGCENPCISPLHTHAADGVLHTESKISSPNTLGQFFTQWGVALDTECVGGYCAPEETIQVFVDGEPYEGNPADIELLDAREVVVVVGSPPAELSSELG